ncbi:MAG: single-stranded-DNA-specific exonuclease RecJ [Candidatus Thiodiazotropha lotti]|nr:single-stranded-DNA-specific exonuclease RecJ [Candidatus Thiodiazotropha lotti]
MKIQARNQPSEPHRFSAEIHPVLQRIYHARGLTRQEELDLALSQLCPVSRLKGVEAAAELLFETIRAGEPIVIIGDYDADGATSTALSMLALQAFGSDKVSYLVPNRFEFGYGLSPEIVDLASQRSPGLIVTVDNGISSLSGVERANSLDIPVLITDHHLPGQRLPEAAVIVNPNQTDDDFPSPYLAGVGVIFYVMIALYNLLKTNDWFQQQGLKHPQPADWLDLVALGTISDLVPLDRNNRILVSQGLKRIRAGRCRPGILALLAVAKRNYQRVVASDMGFAVGPRLNAAGRLDDMGLGIECLLSEGIDSATAIAAELDRLNHARRAIEQQMKQQAESLLQEQLPSADGVLAQGLCLYEKSWHQGVIGILASRIKEQYHRPVIAFADAGSGIIKGSARSIAGLHIRDLLERIDSVNPGLINRFGGHAMAAGLSLSAERFDDFKHAFEQTLEQQLDPQLLEGVILTDGVLSQEEMNLTLAEQIRAGGPWGQGFPEPMFEGRFAVKQQRVVAEHHLKLVLGDDSGEWLIDAIAFNQPPLSESAGQVLLAYRLDVNEFRGQKSAQLIVEKIASTFETTN